MRTCRAGCPGCGGGLRNSPSLFALAIECWRGERMPEVHAEIMRARQAVGASACPGLFRIVAARDGGICRLKLPLGQLSSDAARAIAAAAARFGNGGIDVTNRANLQLRGISPDHEMPLIAALLDAGLGPTRPRGRRHPQRDGQPDRGNRSGADDRRTAGRARSAVAAPVERSDTPRCRRNSASRWMAAKASPWSIIRTISGWRASTARRWRWALPDVRRSMRMTRRRLSRSTTRMQARSLPPRWTCSWRKPRATSRSSACATYSRDMTREQVFDRLSRKVTLRRDLTVAAWRRKAPAFLGHVGIRAQLQDGLGFCRRGAAARPAVARHAGTARRHRGPARRWQPAPDALAERAGPEHSRARTRRRRCAAWRPRDSSAIPINLWPPSWPARVRPAAPRRCPTPRRMRCAWRRRSKARGSCRA